LVKNDVLGKKPLPKVYFLTTNQWKGLENGQKIHFWKETVTQGGNFDQIPLKIARIWSKITL